ncbi:uncharacterized protein ELE39_003591 [Cryptosporidium sp. chipmunk genotype I]|uniref:uncharacterized protein n=1 Tax=Cryptosporidium sp. chipmunk genotype I TaxID=1280935 RepID=UPI00351A62E6|nr:hypothetical protein ELE39_003591 [Cryptosporidium sp. chipmunk genotype I]
MSQSSTLWNQSYSRELIMDHSEGIDWISGDGCLENIKDSHFMDYSGPNPASMEDPLGNNFYDCTDLDESFHTYLIKGLLGENLEVGSGPNNLNDISSVNSIRGQSNVSGSIDHNIDRICHSIAHRIDSVGIGAGALGEEVEGALGGGSGRVGGGITIGLGVQGEVGGRGEEAFDSVNCSYTSNSHSHQLVEPPSGNVLGDQSNCYRVSVSSNNLDIPSNHGVLLGPSSPGAVLPVAPSSSSSSSSSASSSSSSSSSSSLSLPLNSGPPPISLPPRAMNPINLSQSLMTPTTSASSSSVTPLSFSPKSMQPGPKLMGFDVSYQMENTQKRVRIEPQERIGMGIFDDGLVESDVKFADHEIVDLDSSKGRRWSNNSTTSTTSSNFSINTNDGGCVSHINDKVSNENLGIIGHDFQQDKFCSAEDLGSQKPKMVDRSYEMGVIEDENYQIGGQIEGEFFINSDNYLTEEEKLKLRRRGRRRRPGKSGGFQQLAKDLTFIV